VGIKIANSDFESLLKSKGFKSCGERLIISKAQSREFLEYLRDNKQD